jgi:peptidyl-prolyl cis-trans isomerase B (cyclophilin B)
MKTKLFFLVLLAALVAVGITLNRESSSDEDEATPTPKPATKKPAKTATLQPGRVITITTKRGQIKFVLYEKDMPTTTANFAELTSKKFYNGLKFHRVEDVVIQGGDPKGNGTGGSSKKIPLEISNGLGFDKPYYVGMARTDDPNSATSQFFINKLAYPGWDGNYASFGRVFEGQDVVGKIQVGDVMQQVTISAPTSSELAEISKLK